MINLTIDNTKLSVPSGTTILQACQEINIEIPRFCYHERLSIAGNCRMCLVEVEKSPKPVASCAMPVMEGMIIHTNSSLVKKAREGIMEFLLVNHPLDCPICDQGGECDLQDQAMVFGNDRGRYYEFKRAVEDKNWGPLIKTIMTRCIHCTRCIRFATEIAGVTTIGVSGRGNDMEIGTYIEKTFDSELSGNVIDLCPVGALTSKPYSFTSRSWELKNIESIDVLDSLHSNIFIHVRSNKVMRILPRTNEFINEEWIHDRSRFSYDGFQRQRLNYPMIKINNKLVKVSWQEAFLVIKNKIHNLHRNDIAAIGGQLIDVESLMSLKDLINKLGSNNIMLQDSYNLISSDLRPNYLFNSTLEGIERSDVCLLIGINPKLESPLINLRLRKNYLKKGFIVGSIGTMMDTTYPIEHLGNTPSILLKKQHPFLEKLKNAQYPSVIIGSSIFNRPDSKELFNLIKSLIKTINFIDLEKDWCGINIFDINSSFVAGLDIGFVPGKNSYFNLENIKYSNNKYPFKLLYLLGTDEINLNKIDSSTFVIYQGHHGDKTAYRADVILPSTSYIEKNGLYVNIEGRSQETKFALNPPGEAREDWKIIRALSEVLYVKLPYDTLDEIRDRIYDIAPNIKNLNFLSRNIIGLALYQNQLKNIKITTDILENIPFSNFILDFYQTNIISKSSIIMGKCSLHRKKSFSIYPTIR